MSEPVELMVYTFEDYTARRCVLSEVGKLKPDDGYAKRLARQYAPEAVRALVEVVNQNDDLGAKVKAAESLLNRGFGKPDQHTTQDNTVKVVMPWISAQRLIYKQKLNLGQDIVESIAQDVPFDELPPKLQEEVRTHAGQEFDQRQADSLARTAALSRKLKGNS